MVLFFDLHIKDDGTIHTSIGKNKNMNITGCPKKKVPIGLPKPQFLSKTFEIFTVGRLFYSGFMKNFDFKGPKSMFEIFRNSQKMGC